MGDFARSNISQILKCATFCRDAWLQNNILICEKYFCFVYMYIVFTSKHYHILFNFYEFKYTKNNKYWIIWFHTILKMNAKQKDIKFTSFSCATTILYSQNQHKNYTCYSFRNYSVHVYPFHWINSAGIFVILHGVDFCNHEAGWCKWKSPILQWVAVSTLKPLQEKWH